MGITIKQYAAFPIIVARIPVVGDFGRLIYF